MILNPSTLAPLLAARVGPLDFGAPEWLLALLIILPIVYFWRTSRVPASPARRWTALILRIILVAGIVGALAETRLVWSNRGVCVIFLLDQSQSMDPKLRTDAREQLRRVIASKMGTDDEFAIIEFAGDSVLSALPSVRGNVPDPVRVADDSRTDISRAIRLAIATFPTDRQKRIVLISDGNQNAGDALREARIAGMKDADIASVVLGRTVQHEVMIESVNAPSRIQKDSRFIIRVVVSTDQDQRAKLHVLRDSQALPDIDIPLHAGTNVFDVPDKIADGGFHTYQVTVEPDDLSKDTIAANNTGFAYTMVEAPGKVLLIRGKDSDRDYLSGVLASKMNLDVGSAGRLPQDLAGLGAYDCVILENVAAANNKLSAAQMNALESWVKNSGGGVVLIGGDDSYAPGFWKDTPLEAMSPVEMDVKRTKHLASLAMVIMLDKSGSMGAPVHTPAGQKEKMDLANNGAVETLKLLDEADLAQIAAVDVEVKWATGAEMLRMNINNKRILSDNVLAVKAGGGGIFCHTALVHAYDLINSPKVDAMARHVILFADASDAEQPDGCIELARKNFEKKPSVTTSVIGLGTMSDQDVGFLRELARVGHGHFHITDDPMALPRIFAKEMITIKRQAWVEDAKGIVPTIYTSPLMDGFERRGVPRVYGYVGTTLKPRATLAMHGKEADDPLLAHWNYGLGKVAAFTSDDTDRWAKDWVRWEGYEKFWVQTVRWASRNLGNSPLATTTTIEGAEGKVTVDAVTAEGKPINNLQLRAKVVSERSANGPADVKLLQVAPGKYQATFAARERGTYSVGVSDARTNTLVDVSGAVVNYAAEFRDLTPNVSLMTALADASNGAVVTALDKVFIPKPFSVKSYRVLWDSLLLIVAIALLADIAWRRLNFGDWMRPRSVPVGLPAATRNGDSMSAFKSIKSGRAQVANIQKTLRERLAVKAPSPVEEASSLQVPTAVQSQTADQLAAKRTESEAPAEGYAGALMRAKRRAAEAIKEREEK